MSACWYNCNLILNEINLLSKRKAVLPTNLSSQGDQKKSKPIHVQVICRPGTLKVMERYVEQRGQ